MTPFLSFDLELSDDFLFLIKPTCGLAVFTMICYAVNTERPFVPCSSVVCIVVFLDHVGYLFSGNIDSNRFDLYWRWHIGVGGFFFFLSIFHFELVELSASLRFAIQAS